MSILIKGLTMPEKGKCMTIMIFHDGTIVPAEGSEIIGHAVQVPSHGRLIDADKLRSLYDFDGYDDHGEITREDFDMLLCRLSVIRRNIDDMPTIIEAEEAE